MVGADESILRLQSEQAHEKISDCPACGKDARPLTENDVILLGYYEDLTLWGLGGAGGAGESLVIRRSTSGGTGGFNALQKIFEIQRAKGNFGIGQLTVGQADEIGRVFVGANPVNVMKNGQVIGIRSQDGLRVFRFPSQKARGQAAEALSVDKLFPTLIDHYIKATYIAFGAEGMFESMKAEHPRLRRPKMRVDHPTLRVRIRDHLLEKRSESRRKRRFCKGRTRATSYNKIPGAKKLLDN